MLKILSKEKKRDKERKKSTIKEKSIPKKSANLIRNHDEEFRVLTIDLHV